MILITGISHTGSTALLLLLEQLGFPIGREDFPDLWLEFLRDPRVQAILERGEVPTWPRVIKHLGGFCYHLNEHVDRWGWEVEHVFVMVRDLEESVARRAKYKEGRDLTPKAYGKTQTEWAKLSEREKQGLARDHLKDELGALLFNLVPREYPFTCLFYPRWVQDAGYTLRKLAAVLSPDQTRMFNQTFQRVIDPKKVGTY